MGRTGVALDTDHGWDGGEGLALDPSDPCVVYIAAGKYEWASPGTAASRGRRSNDPREPVGDEPNAMAASFDTFGLVFLGTNGRGIYYGTAARP